MRLSTALLALACGLSAQPYDTLLKGGHVIDPKNGIDRVMDVAISSGKIARVAASINSSDAKQTVDVTGLYVTPGLIDIHVHIYMWQEPGGEAVQADAHSFRSGVTTMVDAGLLRLADVPRFQEAHHRALEDPHPRFL